MNDHVHTAHAADYSVRTALRELGRRVQFLDSQIERLGELIIPWRLVMVTGVPSPAGSGGSGRGICRPRQLLASEPEAGRGHDERRDVLGPQDRSVAAEADVRAVRGVEGLHVA